MDVGEAADYALIRDDPVRDFLEFPLPREDTLHVILARPCKGVHGVYVNGELFTVEEFSSLYPLTFTNIVRRCTLVLTPGGYGDARETDEDLLKRFLDEFSRGDCGISISLLFFGEGPVVLNITEVVSDTIAGIVDTTDARYPLLMGLFNEYDVHPEDISAGSTLVSSCGTHVYFHVKDPEFEDVRDRVLAETRLQDLFEHPEDHLLDHLPAGDPLPDAGERRALADRLQNGIRALLNDPSLEYHWRNTGFPEGLFWENAGRSTWDSLMEYTWGNHTRASKVLITETDRVLCRRLRTYLHYLPRDLHSGFYEGVAFQFASRTVLCNLLHAPEPQPRTSAWFQPIRDYFQTTFSTNPGMRKYKVASYVAGLRGSEICVALCAPGKRISKKK